MSRRQGEFRVSKRTASLVMAFGMMLIGIAAAWLVITGLQRRSGEPNIEVARAVQNFGDVHFDNTVQAEFALRNTGGKALEIIGIPQVVVRAGC